MAISLGVNLETGREKFTANGRICSVALGTPITDEFMRAMNEQLYWASDWGSDLRYIRELNANTLSHMRL